MNEDELELAKSAAAGTAAGLTKSFHELVLKLAGPAADEIGMAWAERVRVWRLKRAARLQERIEAMVGNRLLLRPVPLKVLLPALEQASLEENDQLQDLWAALLANTATSRQDQGMGRVFVEILQQLTPVDVLFLDFLWTHRLPDGSLGNFDDLHFDWDTDEPNPSPIRVVRHKQGFKLSLENVRRLGLLNFEKPIDPDRTVSGLSPLNVDAQFRFSAIGEMFVAHCRPPSTP